MKLLFTILKYYLNFLAVISPKLAAKKVFDLFQKVTLKKIKKREETFYKIATHFTIPFEKESLKCYKMGNENDKTVFLIHGWNSNIGCLTLFAKELIKHNYYVIGFNLPGHATNKRSKTNLVESKNAFIKLIEHVKPTKPIHIISHSFGSAVTSYVLPELNYKVDKVVFLTSNNNFLKIFNHFKNIFGFNKTVFNLFKRKVEQFVNQNVNDMIVAKNINKSTINKLLVIHDRFDKVIPFKDAEEIHQTVKNSTLIAFEKIGHYRMLWNPKVVNETVKFLNS